MQIVIDIDDNLYTRLFDNGNEYVADMRRACVAIRKGTPLPKRHGRLIDADVLVDGMEDDYEFCEAVNATPTIIESDKEESIVRNLDSNKTTYSKEFVDEALKYIEKEW